MARVPDFANDKRIPTVSIQEVKNEMRPPQMRIINGEQCWHSDYGRIVAFQDYGTINGSPQLYLKTNVGVVYTNCEQGKQRAEQEKVFFEQWKKQNPDAAQQWEEWGAGPLHREVSAEQKLNPFILPENYGQSQKTEPVATKPNFKDKMQQVSDKLQKFPFFMSPEKQSPVVDLNNFTFRQTRVIGGRQIIQTGREMPISAKMLDAIIALREGNFTIPDLNTPIANMSYSTEQYNKCLLDNGRETLTPEEWDYLLTRCVITGKDVLEGPSIVVNDSHGNRINSFGMVKDFSVDRWGTMDLQSTTRNMHQKGKYISLDPIEQLYSHDGPQIGGNK